MIPLVVGLQAEEGEAARRVELKTSVDRVENLTDHQTCYAISRSYGSLQTAVGQGLGTELTWYSYSHSFLSRPFSS